MSLAYNKAKGAEFETDLVDYLRERFPAFAPDIRRSRLSGRNDQGDIHAKLPLPVRKIHGGTRNHQIAQTRYVIIEAKHVKDFELAEFIKEVTVEVENWTRAVKPADPATGIVVIKRRNRSIGQSYVVQTLDSFLGLFQ